MTANRAAAPPLIFPWGSNQPTRPQRLVAALVIATAASAITLAEFAGKPGHHSDFGLAWFGARALLEVADPWTLVGPGLAFDWRWPLLYPATALVFAMPFAWMSESLASASFIWMSTFVLAWGATRGGWHRVPAFVSLPFLVASASAQWSALLASSWFLPTTAAAWVVKPTIGGALAAAAASKRHLAFAAVGLVALPAVAFAMFPEWVSSWRSVIASTSHMRTPIASAGGFAIAAALLRWRRPEARLIAALALIPQTPAAYDLLILLLVVPHTYHEALALSLWCTLTLLLAQFIPAGDAEQFASMRSMLNVAAAYLPATAMVLRRPNARE